MFRVGMEVAPFTLPGDIRGGHNMPTLDLNTVYIIREIDERALAAGIHPCATLRLVGINGPVGDTNVGVWEIGYRADRFRPVTKTKTQVSFTTGADPDSSKWDNRKPVPARKREGV